MCPPMCLQYIIMALAANTTKTYNHLAMPFYQRARVYAESDGMRVSSTAHTKRCANQNLRAKGSTLQQWLMHSAGA
jgi:hypothetical protein